MVDDTAVRLTLDVHFVNGTSAEAPIPPTLQVAFEDEFDVGFPAFLASFPNWRIKRLYWLAWKVLGAGAEFGVWLVNVTAVDFHTGDEVDDTGGE